jgi:hypothetical protein
MPQRRTADIRPAQRTASSDARTLKVAISHDPGAYPASRPAARTSPGGATRPGLQVGVNKGCDDLGDSLLAERVGVSLLLIVI